MSETGKARFISGNHSTTIDGDVVTVHVPGVDVELPLVAFEAMMTTIPVLPPDHLLQWDCGCSSKGLVLVPATIIYEAEASKWSLAQAANAYKHRANSNPALYSTGGHARFLEGLYHCADQMVTMGAIETNPFA